MTVPGVGRGSKDRRLAHFLFMLTALVIAALPTPGATFPLDDDEALARSRTAIQRVAAGAVECSAETEGSVRYIGPTDDNLLACLSEYGEDADLLIISSGGGDALKAMEAGDLLALLGMRIRVRGMCASSCGNYLVPAASSVSVEPYSAILLHGGPEDSEAYIRAVQDQAELRQREAFPDATEASIAQGREIMRSVMRRILDEHAAFSQRRGVSDEWYRLAEFERPDSGFSVTDFAVVDLAYATRQLAHIRAYEYWFPCSPNERAILSSLISGTALYYRPQTGGGHANPEDLPKGR